MPRHGDRMTPEAATELQRLAADPRAPRMVNANAGSGKTKVLVDRVSRILLQGTRPEKILCLTYTRAAASEMQERLFSTLSEWSVATDETLRDKLYRLYGHSHEAVSPPVTLDTARTSFARALETPEGLKVMTIHAFCERIIARFPVEAGILPGFAPLDDSEARDMLARSRERLLERALQDETVADALHRLTRLKADSTLDALLFDCAREFDRTQRWAQGGGLAGFRKAAGLAEGDTEISLAQAALDETDTDRLQRLAEIARRVWKNADGFVDVVARVQNPTDPIADLNAYGGVFLTAKGEARKRVLVQAVHKEDDFLQLDGPEMRRVVAAIDSLKAARLADTTEALLTLGHAMTLDHARAKHQARGLDFNDLIVKTRDLLKRRDVSDWVAYKLDGGVDHVLLDEAQDTSPEQWDIIDAITEPFAQDSPDRDEPPRTFFAVGDPKQSIYRFQGAAPEIFTRSVRERGGDEGEVRLRMSFRSAQEILDVVDALFVEGGGLQAMFDADSVPEASDLVRHVAFRGDPGCVELWPLAPKAEALEDKEAWDTTPVDEAGNADPRVVLAREIAGTIDHWVTRGEPVFDRDLGAHRPMHAGDVLILVQKRVGGLFDAIIKALKEEGLPVAGADRLVLQEAVVVRDLLAITRFVLLPGDCLSLAEALKSPLFGLDDDQLFELCVDRDGLLWDAVQARDAALANALRTILADAQLAPYDFYARLLDRRGPHGRTYREALFSRLGMEAREALDAFLAQALSHQQQRAPSLLRFMQAFTADAVEIKRDKDPAGGEVRIMTVHGAKGLEAPVVFLPDTTRVPRKNSGALIEDGAGGYVLAPSGADSFALADRLKDADYAQDMREYMRLLYVAMTRAESRLVLCGHHHGGGEQGFADESWYRWFLKVMPTLDGVEAFGTSFDGGGMQGLRYGERPKATEATAARAAREETPLPDWIDRMAAPEPVAATEATPSHLLRTVAPVPRGPGGSGGGFMRGIVIHKLLEHLPDHPPEARMRIATAMLDGYPDFLESEREAMIAQVFAVLDDPDFADVFAHGSRAEVSLAGRLEIGGTETFMTAQVDRLSVVGRTVFLVDYKSGHAPPESVGAIDLAYVAQMAAYRELARAVWPDHAIRCGLLWTEGPALTWLPDPALDGALKRVGQVLTS